MIIKIIIYSLTLIKYPLTNKKGITIIYYIEGWQNIEIAFIDVRLILKSYIKV